jgi:predicted enzyme related to lactoylglutathione lyase
VSEEEAMITKAGTVSVYVSDQQRALEFYTEKLGFEKRADEPMGPDSRWIEVAPPGAETSLVLFTPEGMESRIGSFAGVVLACDDVRRTFEELRGRGVEFTEEPREQPWGMWASFKDQDGNVFGLTAR